MRRLKLGISLLSAGFIYIDTLNERLQNPAELLRLQRGIMRDPLGREYIPHRGPYAAIRYYQEMSLDRDAKPKGMIDDLRPDMVSIIVKNISNIFIRDFPLYLRCILMKGCV